ncbi:nuclear transport factor 2 family protein [Rhodococcus koreensis]
MSANGIDNTPHTDFPGAAADARLQIHDACVRYARGCDRCDREMILSAFHSGATVDYTVFKGSPDEFADWVLPMLQQHYKSTSHLNMNHYVEFHDDGTRAAGELYVFAIMRFERDGERYDLEGMGRYFDEYALRDGQWRLTSRRTITDWERTVHVAPETSDLVKAVGILGTRDNTDPSYQHFDRLRRPEGKPGAAIPPPR